jgi:hypothetical protein
MRRAPAAGRALAAIGALALAVATPGPARAAPLLGQATQFPMAITATYFAAAPVLADVNGDGRPDVVAGSDAAMVVVVMLGRGDGTLAAAVEYPAGLTASDTAVGDVTGDGRPDIVIGGMVQDFAAGTSTAAVSVLAGNGDGTFQAP